MSYKSYEPDMRVRQTERQTDRKKADKQTDTQTYYDSMGKVSNSELTIDNKPCIICYRQEKFLGYIIDYCFDSESNVLCLNRG